jgi:hypothetical protein
MQILYQAIEIVPQKSVQFRAQQTPKNAIVNGVLGVF